MPVRCVENISNLWQYGSVFARFRYNSVTF
jgi:hypothetical protein